MVNIFLSPKYLFVITFFFPPFFLVYVCLEHLIAAKAKPAFPR